MVQRWWIRVRPTAGWRALAAAAAAIAQAGACSIGDLDAGGGCGGTPGRLGVVTFRFEQSELDDLSNASGRAFASGTIQRFRVEMSDGSTLPPLIAESSDTAVFGVDDGGSGSLPLRLLFHRTGIATLRVLRSADRVLVDDVELRVADPRALRLSVGSARLASFDGGDLVGEPSRIVLLPGHACRLYSMLSDGSEAALFGVFSPAVSGAAVVSFVDEGMVAVNFVGRRVHSLQRVTAVAEGVSTVVLEGPGSLRRSIDFEVTATPAPSRLQLVTRRGYVAEWEVGDETSVTALAREVDGSPVYGLAADFAVDAPAVAAIAPEEGYPETARVRFLAPGTVTVTARLPTDPTVIGTATFTVVPAAGE
ncbi:MAG: hypothetical protein QME96_11055 [Myxococcota bacterium]|nr:hypothetical protein [Myxococcota bacterium]